MRDHMIKVSHERGERGLEKAASCRERVRDLREKRKFLSVHNASKACSIMALFHVGVGRVDEGAFLGENSLLSSFFLIPKVTQYLQEVMP